MSRSPQMRIAWTIERLTRFRLLLLSMAIVTLVWLMIVGPSPESDTSRLANVWIGKAIPGIVLIWLTASMLYRLIIYRALDAFAYRDASNSPQTPPSNVAARGQALIAIGFRPLGEWESRFPWNGWKRAWAFVDPTGYVTCSIGAGLVGCLATTWPDGSFVLTLPALPTGVRRGAQSSIVAVSPRDPLDRKYRRHLAEAQAFEAGRAPNVVTSVGHMLATSPAEIRPTRAAMRAGFTPLAIAMLAFAYLMLIGSILL